MGRYDRLSVDIKLSIVEDGDKNNGTLGKGVVALLQGIVDLGSLNKAAKSLKMAYSKAWRIVKETEAGFGFLLITRDGARGSTLTTEGRELLKIYQELEKETVNFVNNSFQEKIEKIYSKE